MVIPTAVLWNSLWKTSTYRGKYKKAVIIVLWVPARRSVQQDDNLQQNIQLDELTCAQSFGVFYGKKAVKESRIGHTSPFWAYSAKSGNNRKIKLFIKIRHFFTTSQLQWEARVLFLPKIIVIFLHSHSHAAIFMLPHRKQVSVRFTFLFGHNKNASLGSHLCC